MGYVAILCSQCGHSFQVDDNAKYGVCDYCGTRFLLKDVIHNYYTVNQISQVNHIIGLNPEKSLEAAENLLLLAQYGRAKIAFEQLTVELPNDVRVWWGANQSNT